MKKIFILIAFFGSLLYTSAQKMPGIASPIGLPGAGIEEDLEGTPGTFDNNPWENLMLNVLDTLIQFIAVIAVLSLMLSSFILFFSGGDEEKAKKAKIWVIWSLVGILVSTFSIYFIDFINNLRIR